MTNAIKFTRTEKVKRITITVGASLTRPSGVNELGVRYVEPNSRTLKIDRTTEEEWGDGEIIYLSIGVTDTGRGLDETEIKSLFNLFTQASPKTYTQYGGSGLGVSFHYGYPSSSILVD